MKLTGKKGQSMIEYGTMATLVMVGILLMGPYVVRSINAFFQAIDDDIRDSVTEEISQGPSEGYGLPSGCTCTPPLGSPLLDAVCGTGPCCGGGGCAAWQKLQVRTCDPPDCEKSVYAAEGVPVQMFNCVNENACCTPWVETGNCGANAAPSTGHTPGGCPAGEKEYRRQCGPPQVPPVYEYACQGTCSSGPAPCPPVLPGAVCAFCSDISGSFTGPGDNADWCEGDNTDLSATITFTHVANTAACTPARKCEAVCRAPFVPAAGNPSLFCECPTLLASAGPVPTHMGAGHCAIWDTWDPDPSVVGEPGEHVLYDPPVTLRGTFWTDDWNMSWFAYDATNTIIASYFRGTKHQDCDYSERVNPHLDGCVAGTTCGQFCSDDNDDAFHLSMCFSGCDLICPASCYFGPGPGGYLAPPPAARIVFTLCEGGSSSSTFGWNLGIYRGCPN